MRLFPRLITETEAPYGNNEGKVRVLPPEVAHRITAGEEIERPASAVKELVENALDAGTTRVEVEIQGGGVFSLLRVHDDGSGMSPDDAERSVVRHATSKISSAEDLAQVASLGFRGGPQPRGPSGQAEETAQGPYGEGRHEHARPRRRKTLPGCGAIRNGVLGLLCHAKSIWYPIKECFDPSWEAEAEGRRSTLEGGRSLKEAM